MMNKSIFVLLLAASLTSPSQANEGLDITATLNLASEAIGRGFSITNHRPAYGGSLQIRSKGVYALVASNRFGLAGATNESYAILGYTHVSGRLTSDISFVQYLYNSRLASDFREAAIATHYQLGLVSIGAGARGSVDYFAHSGSALYTYADISAPVYQAGGTTISVSGLLGRQQVQKNIRLGAPDWTYWKAGVTLRHRSMSLDLSYHDTDIPASLGLPAGARLVSTLSYGF